MRTVSANTEMRERERDTIGAGGVQNTAIFQSRLTTNDVRTTTEILVCID